MRPTLRIKNSLEPSHGGHGYGHFCEFYLQELYQAPTLNIKFVSDIVNRKVKSVRKNESESLEIKITRDEECL